MLSALHCISPGFWAKLRATLPVAAFSLLVRRRQLAGSIIGGIRETQEMLDFCADHGITADVEQIRIQQINEAFDRLLRDLKSEGKPTK